MRVRYVVLVMLVLLSVITYLDRICIAVAGPTMQKELGISDSQWGWVLTAFLLGYGIFEIPSGGWGDLVGQRKILTRIVVWWSAFTMLTAVATSYYALVATRFLFGAGEAGAYPNASGCIARWFPLAERARAQGLVWGASRLGGALTPLLVIPLLKVLPWQAPFFIFGAIGLVWSAIWFFWFRDDPAQHPAVGPQELAEITGEPSFGTKQVAAPPAIEARPVASGNPYAAPSAFPYKAATGGHLATADEASHSKVPWARLFASPQLWLIVAMYWFYVFAFIFFMFWLPKYLTDGRGLSRDAMAICVALTFAMGALGNVVGGWASDRLTKRYGLSIGRKLIGVTCLALSGMLLFAAAMTPGKWTAAVLLILCFGITDGMLPCSWAICLDVGKRYSGAVSGAMNTAGQAAGSVSIVLYGYLIDWYGNYDWPLLLLAPSMLISAILFALINPNHPLVPEMPAAISAE